MVWTKFIPACLLKSSIHNGSKATIMLNVEIEFIRKRDGFHQFQEITVSLIFW